MKHVLLLFMLVNIGTCCFSQVRPINKLTLETTYSYTQIHKSLRDLIDKADKPSYFNDDFFNDLLRKIINDKQFSDKEKVQLFYLMQKKLGFAFVGVNYLPPKQNYFQLFMGKVITFRKTHASLKDLHYDTKGILTLVDSTWKKDAILASNALLLASVLNPKALPEKIQYFSKKETILKAKNPGIFNHYVCLSTSLVQDSAIAAQLVTNVLTMSTEPFIEDALCALYSKNNSVITIRDYILKEKYPEHDLAIQTALCALWAKVPEATFQKSTESLLEDIKEKWKKDLCRNILNKKTPFNYSLSKEQEIVSKIWEGVTYSLYLEGALISNGDILEFDPN